MVTEHILTKETSIGLEIRNRYVRLSSVTAADSRQVLCVHGGRFVVLLNSHQSFVGCFNVSRLTCSTHLLGNSPLMKLNHLPEKQTGQKAWFHLVEIWKRWGWREKKSESLMFWVVFRPVLAISEASGFYYYRSAAFQSHLGTMDELLYFEEDLWKKQTRAQL